MSQYAKWRAGDGATGASPVLGANMPIMAVASLSNWPQFSWPPAWRRKIDFITAPRYLANESADLILEVAVRPFGR